MKRFKKVYIEITNLCNLSCNFCPKTSRKLETMDIARFQSIIDAVKPFTDYVYLHLMGEPLLNPNLAQFLDYCLTVGLHVNLTTNGTLLNKQKAILLSSPALRQVNISLSSFEANVMTEPLAQYLNDVTDFVKAAAAQGSPICSIRLWNMDTNALKGSNQLNADILGTIEAQLSLPSGYLAQALTEKPSVKLMDKIYLNMAEKFEWPDLSKTTGQEAVFCYGLRDQMGVLVDGTVVPCCLDSEGNIALGNLLETPLSDILASERAQALYDGFSNRRAVEPLCQRCGYATRY